ncbi:hypothetical protein Hanom_Chr10g00961841 [Helianthus anomalus]
MSLVIDDKLSNSSLWLTSQSMLVINIVFVIRYIELAQIDLPIESSFLLMSFVLTMFFAVSMNHSTIRLVVFT